MMIERTDGHEFRIEGSRRNPRIKAGCRDFDIAEACAHWCDRDHHKHRQSVIILSALFKFKRVKRKRIPKHYRSMLGYR